MDTKPLITVPRPLFDQLVEGMSCTEIVEEARARAAFKIQGRWIISKGGISNAQRGWYQVFGHEFQYLEEYKGDLKPLDYGQHFQEVTDGQRPRSYSGMKIKLQGRWIVFIGSEIIIEPSEEGQQLSLFK